jgi:hypothetical protein
VFLPLAVVPALPAEAGTPAGASLGKRKRPAEFWAVAFW